MHSYMLDKQLTSTLRLANSEVRPAWSNGPSAERMLIARTRQFELIAQARAYRLGQSRNQERGPLALDRVRGFRLRLGWLMIVVGRAVSDEEPCADAA